MKKLLAVLGGFIFIIGLLGSGIFFDITKAGIVDDTYVTSGSGENRTYGDINSMSVSNVPDRFIESRAFIKFDVNFTENITIHKATLRLSAWLFGDYISGTINLHQVYGDWGENLITWRSQPPYSHAMDTKPVQDAEEFDATGIVQKWAEGEPNYGFALTGTPDISVTYMSKESPESPELLIDYVIDAGDDPSQEPEDKDVIITNKNINTTNTQTGLKTQDDISSDVGIPLWSIGLMLVGGILLGVAVFSRR
jgi:hypothetical protein